MKQIPLHPVGSLPVNGRSCQGCTKCCEGWLTGEIDGELITIGNPCSRADVGRGCKDYSNRPENPCVSFHCDWLINPDVPEVFAPKDINTILVKREEEGIRYYQVVEAGEKLDSSVLSWAIQYCMLNSYNMYWTAGGIPTYFGSSDFVEYMNTRHAIL